MRTYFIRKASCYKERKRLSPIPPKKSWQAVRDDPEWQAVREASEQERKLVDKVESVYLNPTDYSPLK